MTETVVLNTVLGSGKAIFKDFMPLARIGNADGTLFVRAAGVIMYIWVFGTWSERSALGGDFTWD